jgi:histidine ammonia-lyase
MSDTTQAIANSDARTSTLGGSPDITLGNSFKLTLEDTYKLVQANARVRLNPDCHNAMNLSYQFLKSCIDQNKPIYGVNTNFGDQVKHVDAISDVSYESINSRQENLIRSMACSLGKPVSNDVVRVAMLLRANCLAQGYSGVTPQFVEAMLQFLNANIVPVVNNYGSIGASGDLIPLACIAAAMTGEDVDVFYQNQLMKAPQALAAAGLTRIKPMLRDSLSMINGTSFMTAIASLTLFKLKRLFPQMLSAIGMMLESMLVISSAYHPLVHQLKNHSGEIYINNFLINFWKDSTLLSDLDELRDANRAETSTRPVQDYYSLRSVPQGFGTFHENLVQAQVWIEDEMNSVNDNPIIDAVAKQIYHGSNFMGYYVTDACDILKMNISQASTWLHALLANLLHARKNHGLNTNLAENPAINNGFRSLQILTAAIVVQNRKLSQSQNAFMLPTEGDNQDVNSLGTHAALDFQEATHNLQRLTAIMLLAATQALELRGLSRASTKAQAIARTIRTYSPKLTSCRPMTSELELITQLLDEDRI